MYSNEMMDVPTGKTASVAAICFVLLSTAFAQKTVEGNTNAPRHLKGRTQLNLHGNSETEQYVFARPDGENTAKQFLLIQFEQFLPTNHFTYDYASMPTTQMGNLSFNYDVKSLPDIAALMLADAGSDGAALVQLLAKRHISLPHNTAMVRMFHVPSADRRTELMILYGEALPPDVVIPVLKSGDPPDKESSRLALTFLERARRELVVRAR